MISASGCVINSGARGSTMQAASRSATRRRCSTSRKTKMPASDDSSPPSNLAITVLPPTGDRPGSGSIESVMAGMASRKWRGLESTTKSYAKSVICATSANLRCIIRASRDGIPEPLIDLSLGKYHLVVREAWQISENDPDGVVLDPDDPPVIPPEQPNAPVLKALAWMEK